jgi:hypothetical protein
MSKLPFHNLFPVLLSGSAILPEVVSKAKVPLESSRDSLAQLKLMGALVRLDALQPDGFTAQQLAEAARVELETARSYLKKEPAFAAVVAEAKVPAAGSDGRGRPANLYLLSASRRAELIERLVAIRQELDRTEGIGEPSEADLFAPLEQLEDTLSELEGGSDPAEEWRDRLDEARLEFASAMADYRALQSNKSPKAKGFSERIAKLQDRLAILEQQGPPSTKTAADQEFEIEIERWEKAEHVDATVRVTAASLRISVADNIATRNIAPWLKSVRESASLAAYPLALWLTKSWWRLRWEPAALGLAKPDWRAAHELTFAAAADKDFEWPPLVMGSQGESLFAVCLPEKQQHSGSGLRYLDSFRASISGSEFERAVDKFVEQTIARLNGLDSELSVLWSTLKKDRADPNRASYCRLEALLGFDLDKASPALIQAVESVNATVDPLAVDELVSAFGASRKDDPNDLASLVLNTNDILHASLGLNGHMFRSLPTATLHGDKAMKLPPWDIGKRLATQCRNVLGFGLEPISNERLGDLLSLTSAQLGDGGLTIAQGLPFGVAINADNDSTNFLFRRSAVEGRRFEAARFIADAQLSPPESTWMLETDTKTVRQRGQRAFAVEFLMPFDGLNDYLGRDFSDEKIEKAASHYGVSPIAAQLQLENNKERILQAA